jgi:hypothetical protein
VVPGASVALVLVALSAFGIVAFIRGLDLGGSAAASATHQEKVHHAVAAVKQWAGGRTASVRCRALSRRTTTSHFGGRYTPAAKQCRNELTGIRRAEVVVARVRLSRAGNVAHVAVAERRRTAVYTVRRVAASGAWRVTATAGAHDIEALRIHALIRRMSHARRHKPVLTNLRIRRKHAYGRVRYGRRWTRFAATKRGHRWQLMTKPR